MLVQLAKQSSTFRVEFILTVLQRNVIKLRSVQEWNSLSAADTARYLLTMSPDKPSQDEKGCSGLQEFLTVLISSVDKWQDLRLSNHRSFYWWFAELLNHLPDDVLCNFLKTANLKTEDQMQVLMGLNLENDFNIFLKLILNGFNIQLLPASFLKKAFLLGDRLLQLESTHNQSTALLIETVDEIQRIPLNKEQAKNVQKLLVQLIDVCKEEKYPAPKDWQECAIDLTPNSLPSDDSSMLMEEENPTCVLPEEKVIGKKRHKIIDQENSGNSLVSFYKKQKTDSKALEDEKSSVDEKALALEVKENKFSSGSTGLIGALMTQGQFKKPIVARAAKLKSRIQRGIIMNPGDAWVCLALPSESSQSTQLLIEYITVDSVQRCWIYTLTQQQGVFYYQIKEIPTTEKLPNLQNHELTAQQTTFIRVKALQQFLQEHQGKHLTGYVQPDSSIDWERWHEENMAQIEKVNCTL